MVRLCPYRSFSYASFRLHIFRRIFSHPEASIRSRTFTSSKTDKNRSSHLSTGNESSIYYDGPYNPSRAPDNFNQPAHNLEDRPEPGHNDPLKASRDIKPESFPEGSAEAPSHGPQPSETFIKSPLQIRKGKTALRWKTSPASDPGPLAKNPWAVMLASPPRACSVTRARVPTELLVRFELVRHPEFSSLWFMPKQLLDLLETATSAEDKDGSPDGGKRRKPLPFIRVSNSAAVLRQMARLRRPKYATFISNRMKQPHGPLSRNDVAELVWRQDMADLVLENLRKHVVRGLTLAAKHSGKRDASGALSKLDLASDPGAQEIEESLSKLGVLENMNNGAVLMLGKEPKLDVEAAETSDTSNLSGAATSEHVEDGLEATSSQSLTSVPDFVKLPDREARVPVFNLRKLLSADNLAELRASYDFHQHSALFLRPFGLVSVKPLIALWKLQGYMLDMEEFSP